MKRMVTMIGLILFFGSQVMFCAQKAGYKIGNRIKLPGNGGWDYLSVDEINDI